MAKATSFKAKRHSVKEHRVKYDSPFGRIELSVLDGEQAPPTITISGVGLVASEGRRGSSRKVAALSAQVAAKDAEIARLRKLAGEDDKAPKADPAPVPA